MDNYNENHKNFVSNTHHHNKKVSENRTGHGCPVVRCPVFLKCIVYIYSILCFVVKCRFWSNNFNSGNGNVENVIYLLREYRSILTKLNSFHSSYLWLWHFANTCSFRIVFTLHMNLTNKLSMVWKKWFFVCKFSFYIMFRIWCNLCFCPILY